MGYVSQTIRDLSIPRNGQDTFVLPLDRTTGHHNSTQLVIKHKSTQPIASSTFHRILIRLHAVPRSLLLLILITFHHDFSIVPFPSLLMTHTLLFFFPSHYCSSLSHSSHTIHSPDSAFPHSLVIFLCISLVHCLEYKHDISMSKNSRCWLAP